MRSLKLIITISLVIGPLHVLGQYIPSADTLLNRMTGKWVLKGTIAGGYITHDITATWVLGHQYIELKETSRDKLANGMPIYEAIVFISRDTSRNLYDCLWLDNTSNKGLSNGIVAHAETNKPNEIALLFKTNKHSYFHTTFTFDKATDSWHWLMTSEENGKTKMFADAIMVR